MMTRAKLVWLSWRVYHALYDLVNLPKLSRHSIIDDEVRALCHALEAVREGSQESALVSSN